MLALTYIPEDEWHGELRVKAAHAGFSGMASAWFNRADISRFAAELRALAHGQAEVAELKGGYFSDSVTGSAPVETHVGIRIARRPTRFVAAVALADPDDAIRPQTASLELEIAWAALFRAADAIEAMVEAGGTADLKVAPDSMAGPDRFKARHRIRRPYTPLFLALRRQLRELTEGMERQLPDIPPAPGMIVAQIDWDQARLECSWGVGDEYPALADPVHGQMLDLTALKAEAERAAHPRAFFDSYAAYILKDAQDHLIDFVRDGPTDDVPFERHLIFVRGLTGGPAQIWVSNIKFSFEEEPE